MTRTAFVLLLGAALLLELSSTVGATTYAPGTVTQWPGNGHYYQTSAASALSPPYTFENLEAYVKGLTYNGLPGHLVTYTSQAEYNAGGTHSERGYVGAVGNNTAGSYYWTAGPEGGQAMGVYGVFYPRNFTACSPFTRVYVINGQWYACSNTITCQSYGSGGVINFTVEYETDTVPPQAQTTFPNGGENLAGAATFRWTASDAFGRVTGIDIHLSRTGPAGPFEEIAIGLPNTGTFNWIVTGPSAENSAYLRITARDTGGNITSDLSNEAFSIQAPVPTKKTTWGAIKALYR